MNKEELIQRIEQITDRKQLSFFVDGEPARDRFNHDESEKSEVIFDHGSNRAFLLFKWISYGVFAKARGANKAKNILPIYSRIFDKYGLEEKVTDDAVKTVKDFLIGNGEVTNSMLCSARYPFSLQEEINLYPEDEKEIRKIYSKEKEVIFNQVNLFTQARFRCFLLNKTLDANDICPDLDNFSSGIVYCHHKRIIPTINGSYSLASFKEEAIKGMKEASNSFPYENVEDQALLSKRWSIYLLLAKKQLHSKKKSPALRRTFLFVIVFFIFCEVKHTTDRIFVPGALCFWFLRIVFRFIFWFSIFRIRSKGI